MPGLPNLSNGKAHYAFVGLLALTWIFWNVAIFHCTFIHLDRDDYSLYDDDLDYGIFTIAQHEVYNDDKIYACVAYPPYMDHDGATKSARFFGAMGFIFHTLALLIVLCLELCVFWRSHLLWRVVRCFTIASLVSSLLIFSIFGTDYAGSFDDNKGVPGGAGTVAIINVFLLCGTMVLAWLINAPENPVFFCRHWTDQDTVQEEGTDKAMPTVNLDPTTTEDDRNGLEGQALPEAPEPILPAHPSSSRAHGEKKHPSSHSHAKNSSLKWV